MHKLILKSATIFVGLFFSINLAFSHPLDSVGSKVVDGKYYVLHKVEKGQTLYAISKMYKVGVDAITNANPSAEKGLNIGDVLMIPKGKPPVKMAAEPKKEVIKTKEEGGVIYHTVKPGETLFKIAGLYNISVDELKDWNNLSSNVLSSGQKLIVKKGAGPIVVKDNEVEEEKPYVEKPYVEKPKVEKQKEVKPMEKPSYSSGVSGEVIESGNCEVIMDKTIDQERNFAVHPNAPVGTIIMVTNSVTNQSVFTRVVANSSADGGSDVVIRLTNAALKKIGAVGGSAKVKISYAN